MNPEGRKLTPPERTALYAAEEKSLARILAATPLDALRAESESRKTPDWCKLCLRLHMHPTLRGMEPMDILAKLDPNNLMSAEVRENCLVELARLKKSDPAFFMKEFAEFVGIMAERLEEIPVEWSGQDSTPMRLKTVRLVYVWTLLAGTDEVHISGPAIAKLMGCTSRTTGTVLLRALADDGWIELLKKGSNLPGHYPSLWRWRGCREGGTLTVSRQLGPENWPEQPRQLGSWT